MEKKPIYGSLLLLILTTIFSVQYSPYQKLDAQIYSGLENSQTNSTKENIANGPTNKNLYPSFSDNFNLNDYNNWHNIIGNWSFIPYGLHGGINGNVNSAPNNILVVPVVSNNQSIITTSFKVNALDENVSNYASIVYSWIDPNNYQQTGINIYKDNVYILFSKVINGVLYNSPSWPGIKTDLKWNPGAFYIMSIVNRGNSQDIVLNGTKLITHNDNNSISNNGYVGLNYGRIKDIVFYNFNVQNHNNLPNK
jgi:hypothetical protein